MLATSSRLLRLLSLLWSRPDWSGSELAARLGVTTRTVRRDIDRLRELGYPVHAAMGAVGGYRLAPGGSLPPLLLDDEEAVAVVVGLHSATNDGIAGIEESTLRALSKLEQVLPSRLRRRVTTLRQAIVTVPPEREALVNATNLTTISSAIQARETLRFDYTSHHGARSRRDVEPHRMVRWTGRWYLVGWDVHRTAWRTFRVDRVAPRTPNGPRFIPRDPPDGDVAAYLRRTMGFEMWPNRAVLRVHAAASEIGGQVDGVVTPLDESRCRLELATSSFDLIGLVMGMLDVEFEVESPPELADRLRTLAERFRDASNFPIPGDE